MRKNCFLGVFMYNLNQNNTFSVKNIAIEALIQNIIISCGISPQLYGYRYLKEAIKIVVKSPRLLNNITKELYPAVADACETTPCKVERSIRHAIDIAWGNGKIYFVNTLYGVPIFCESHKPTNGEFIAIVSDKLLLEIELNVEHTY